MNDSTTKLHYLEFLCGYFLEPKDIMNLFPGGTGLYSSVGDALMSISTTGDNGRKQRVNIFLEWLNADDGYGGNKYQEFIDVLKKETNYCWLVPLLTDCDNFDAESIFRYLKKPEKIKRIFQVIFPALENINVNELLIHLENDLSDDDREGIENIASRLTSRHGMFALLNNLIYKAPGWISNFIDAVKELNYNATSSMFEDVEYADLATALKDYFECFDDSVVNELVVDEQPEAMNEQMACIQQGVTSCFISDADVPSCSLMKRKQNDEKENCQKHFRLSEQQHIEIPAQPESMQYELRNYQKELSKLALNGTNVIICERTGSGKTRVAAHIIGEHLKGKVTKVGQCEEQKVAFFTPTGGLAEQQCGKMKDYLPNIKRIDMLRGNLEDHLEKDFQKRIYSSDLIVMTPQILLNCLKDNSVKSLFDFSMMIFDECHYAHASHPYAEILRRYLIEKKPNANAKPNAKSQTIQIIGLTATLGVGASVSIDGAKDHIFKLLGIMDAEDGIVYVKDPDNVDELNIVCHAASEESIRIDIDDDDDFFRQLIRETTTQIIFLIEKLDVSKALGDTVLKKGNLTTLDKEFETWCCKLRHASGNLSAEDSKGLGRDARSCADALQCLYSAYTICYNCHSIHAIAKIEDFVEKHYIAEKEKNTTAENNLHELIADTLNKLVNCVDDTKNKTLDIMKAKIISKSQNDEFRCMVMVSRRYFADCIKNWISGDSELGHLKPLVYIGIGNKSSSDCPGMSHSAQNAALQKFKKGDCKVLVCTPDAAGVGIDIPDCNLVITVDCVKNEISKAQLSGRVRAKNGEVLHIYFGNNIHKDKLSGEKLQLMEKAKRQIHKMLNKNPDDYRNQMLYGRKMALEDLEKAEMKKLGTKILRVEGGNLLLCRKCSVIVCHTRELIRMNGNHHTVDRIDFKDKFAKVPHQSRGNKIANGSMTHFNKISCDKCKLDWGNEVTWKNYLMPIITIKGFKIKDQKTGKVFQPRKWKATRLKILEKSRDKSLYDKLFTKCDESEVSPDSSGSTC
uniref:antiviral innate immune response receptor RIG-I-like isoform X1 n=2 Tax=Styela clava TaxID=7725 RepID=UPI00193A24E0|nr:antiviral innate immune response receptor RIG-I-like isoform X1 [Styela clava]